MDDTFFNPEDFTVAPYCVWCKGANVHSHDHDHDWESFVCDDCGGGTEFSGDPTRPEVERIKDMPPDLDSLLETVQLLREDTHH